MFNVLISDLYYEKNLGILQKSMLNFQRGQQFHKNWGFTKCLYVRRHLKHLTHRTYIYQIYTSNLFWVKIFVWWWRRDETLSWTSLKINLYFGLKLLRLFLICFENRLRNLVRFGIQPILDKCALKTLLCKKHKNTVFTSKFTSVSSVKMTNFITAKFVKDMCRSTSK